MFSLGDLRHAHPRLADRRRRHRRHREPSTRTARSGRSAASSRRSWRAADAGAKLFLVPPDNCDDGLERRRDERTTSAGEGRHHAQRRRSRSRPTPTDHDADLPACAMSDQPTPDARADRRRRRRRRPCAGRGGAARSRRTPPRPAGTSRRGSTRWSPPPTLVGREPALAAAMGLDAAAAAGSLTPVEQDELPPDQPLETVLEQIMWPAGGGRLRRGRRAAGAAARTPTPQIPEDPRRGRGVRRASTRTARRCGSSRARPAPGRRTARCGCGPTTTRQSVRGGARPGARPS